MTPDARLRAAVRDDGIEQRRIDGKNPASSMYEERSKHREEKYITV
jgi:hypothetical protein